MYNRQDIKNSLVIRNNPLLFAEYEEHYLSQRIKETLNNDLPWMIQALEEVYPGKFEVHSIDSVPTFIIKFDQFVISNSKNKSAIIRDLYVAIKMEYTNRKLEINSLLGCRTTLTVDEKNASYSHSHISSNNYNMLTYSNFCLGTGSLNDLVTFFKDDENYNLNGFKLLLFQIEPYLEWESLEGGPYKEIKEIVPREVPYIFKRNDYNFTELFQKVDESIQPNDFDLVLDSDTKIINNDKINNAIKLLLSKEQLVYIASNKEYVNSNSTISNIDLYSEVMFGDRKSGEKIKLLASDFITESFLKAPNDVVKEVIKYLEGKLKFNIIKNYEHKIKN